MEVKNTFLFMEQFSLGEKKNFVSKSLKAHFLNIIDLSL